MMIQSTFELNAIYRRASGALLFECAGASTDTGDSAGRARLCGAPDNHHARQRRRGCGPEHVLGLDGLERTCAYHAVRSMN